MKLALGQIDVAFGDVPKNLAKVKEVARAAAAAGAKLVLFPECALTGYGFESLDDARRAAIGAPGPVTGELGRLCAELGLWLVVGTIEKDADRAWNASLLIGPTGLAHKYRKLHLPFMGADRFVEPGDLPMVPAETPLGRIGLAICYDGSFPESARALKLAGAQLVALVTNWPQQAEISRTLQSRMRAFENHVNYAACNRVGSEAGFRFPGGSQIVDFHGKVVAQAGEGEQLLLGELDLAAADDNRIVHLAGKYELDRIAHRRPEHYGRLVEPNG
jgi:predicted amidohydrolase